MLGELEILGQAKLSDGEFTRKFQKVLAAWQPDTSPQRDAGWKAHPRPDSVSVETVVEKTKGEALTVFQTNNLLLGHPEYQRLKEEERRLREDLLKLPNTPEMVLKLDRVSNEQTKLAWKLSSAARWHTKVGWKAEDYFQDPQVIALCKAIEANDLAEMERLIKAGVDINAQGVGKMTPLLWSFYDYQFPRFELLLKHGANPNVIVTKEVACDRILIRGYSVTLLACREKDDVYFDAVFAHGGDPNLIPNWENGWSYTPLHNILHCPQVEQRLHVLIDKGLDLHRKIVQVNGEHTWSAFLPEYYGIQNAKVGLILIEAAEKVRKPYAREVYVKLYERGEQPLTKAMHSRLFPK